MLWRSHVKSTAMRLQYMPLALVLAMPRGRQGRTTEKGMIELGVNSKTGCKCYVLIKQPAHISFPCTQFTLWLLVRRASSKSSVPINSCFNVKAIMISYNDQSQLTIIQIVFKFRCSNKALWKMLKCNIDLRVQPSSVFPGVLYPY